LYQARPLKIPMIFTQIVQQIYVLSLLGRAEEAGALLKKAQADYPDDRELILLSDHFADMEKDWMVWSVKPK